MKSAKYAPQHAETPFIGAAAQETEIAVAAPNPAIALPWTPTRELKDCGITSR
jgi:hypothetical protein